MSVVDRKAGVADGRDPGTGTGGSASLRGIAGELGATLVGKQGGGDLPFDMGSDVSHMERRLELLAASHRAVLEQCASPQPLEALDEQAAAQLWAAGFLRETEDGLLVVAGG